MEIPKSFVQAADPIVWLRKQRQNSLRAASVQDAGGARERVDADEEAYPEAACAGCGEPTRARCATCGEPYCDLCVDPNCDPA